MNTDFKLFMAGAAIKFIMLNSRQDAFQFSTDKHGQDSRRRFICSAGAAVIRFGRNGETQNILIIIHCLYHSAKHQKETRIFGRRISRLEKIFSLVCGNGPVVVFPTPIDPFKRLFMEEADHVILSGDLLHCLHGKLVVVDCYVGCCIYAGKFMLPRSCFIVLRLCHDTELPEFFVQLLHKRGNTGFDRPKIMIRQLLAFRGQCAKKGTPGINQVFALVINSFVDEKIFLFGADRRPDRFRCMIAKQTNNPQALAIDCLHGAKKRCLHVKCFAPVGTESRRNAEDIVFQESIGGRIPGSISPRFKCCTKAARRKARCIRLSLNQFTAGKIHQNLSVAGRGNKAVMFFCGNPCHRLEPVRKMGGSFFDSPFLHSICDDICRFRAQPFSFIFCPENLRKNIFRQALLHNSFVKNIDPE